MLTEQQKKAVSMLWNGGKVQDVAAALGVHRCTIWRWKKKKAFWKEWDRLHRIRHKEMLRRYKQSDEYKQFKRDQYNAKRRANRLEKKVKEAADRIKGGNTKEFDRLWEKWKRECKKAGMWF